MITRIRSVRHVVVMAVCVGGLWLGAAAAAQTQTSTIEGTVRAPDGALLPGATVTVSGGATMGTRTMVTSDSGGFRFPSLLPGEDYVVEIALDRFKGQRHERIVALVGQTATLHVMLELAAVTGEVTVVGRAPIVDATSATASTHFGPDLLANIPNTQRDWSQTVLAAPGVVDGTAENYNGLLFSSRGGSVVANQMAVDGVINTVPLHNISQGAGTVFESIEQLQVVSGALPAELGNVGGGFVNIVTKSGGNTFRGEAGVYVEDDGLQSDNVDSEQAAVGLTTAKITDFTDWGVNVGGPIAKDRIWFDMAAANKELGTVVSGFPFPDTKKEQYYSGKVTWQAAPGHQITALYNYTDWDFPYTGGSAFITPEATVQSLFKTQNFKVKWTGTFNNSLLAEVDFSFRDSNQANAPQAGAANAYLDAATGVISGANLTYFDIDYRRNLPKASLAWFKPGWYGSHQFKGGLEVEDSHSDFLRYGTGPLFFHYLVAGQPTLAFFWNQANGVTSEYAMRGLHFYVQDNWSLSRRVTLNLGLRINTWRAHWPEQGNNGFSYGANVNFPATSVTADTTAIEWSPVEPRVAVNVALDDRGATVLRFGINRYHHGMDMSYFVTGNPMASGLTIHPWADFDGDRFADPNEVFAPISSQVAGGPNNPIDPDLRNPYTDEVTVGVARELFQDASLTVNATWRRDQDLIDDIGSNSRTATYQQAPYPDPGDDGLAGTADDATITVFHQVTGLGVPNLLTTTNPELARREYSAVELIFNKRLSHRWQALASLAFQDATGTLQQNRVDASGTSAAFNDPNTLTNIEGPLVYDAHWQFKAMGTWLAPGGLSFSGYYLSQSGLPLYRTLPIQVSQGPVTIVAEPRDEHREDSFSRVDVRAEWSFAAVNTARVSVLFDVFNLFNANAVTNRNESTTQGGGFTPTGTRIQPFGRPLAVQTPRTARFGVRVRF